MHISKYLENIFIEGELRKEAIISILEIVQNEGVLDEKVVSSILEHTTLHRALVGKTQMRPSHEITETKK